MTDAYRSDALSGKRALVTGGARGIGEATVRQLAAMGADLVIADLNLELAQEVVKDLEKSGSTASAVSVDLTDREATRAFGAQMNDIDILVNNAAPSQTNAPFMEIPDSEWEVQFAVIMWAPLILTREIGRSMAERGGGAIVNISSMAARSPVPFVAPYAAAKAALEIITKVTAAELGPKGVRCNAVAPTFVPTERNRPVWERMGFTENIARGVALGRTATTTDVADVVAWLASPAASFISAQVVYVDGGGSTGPAT
jgi:NAD(P)-dependent dehydrogenase (short-subunit alcohol dehydrogenase family)